MLTQSYVHGADARPLLGMTLGAFLSDAAARWGEREALVSRHQGVRLSYRALDEAAEAFAAGLLALGLAPGERVGIWSPNCAEWVIAQYATAKAGLILVNVNPAYRLSELEYALGKVGCAALIHAAAFKTSDYCAMLRELMPELAGAEPGRLSAARAPGLRAVIQIGGAPQPGALDFAAIAGLGGAAEREALAALGPTLQFDDAINIQFTSGTTGAPKGATLTHHNVLNNGYFVGEAMRLTEADRLCIPVPMYHCFGMVLGVLAAHSHGAAAVFPADAFEPLSVLECVAAERCTALHGVPTMFIAELDHPRFEEFDLSSLRTGIMAGSTCPEAVMQRVAGRMNMDQVIIVYGMTETSPMSFACAVDDPLDLRCATVGRIAPHVEAKVIDAEGRVVAPGETGELLTRGYLVMLGYWDDPERTAEAIDPAGWMRTGDLATLDAEGYCRIVGRIKDMVIRGGENIYPREVEEFLYTHPAIRDVQVFGVPDEKYGEELCAWIVLASDASEDEVREYCRGRIAHYKIPRHIRFVEDYPMTVTGKAQKFLMRERMAKELSERPRPQGRIEIALRSG